MQGVNTANPFFPITIQKQNQMFLDNSDTGKYFPLLPAPLVPCAGNTSADLISLVNNRYSGRQEITASSLQIFIFHFPSSQVKHCPPSPCVNSRRQSGERCLSLDHSAPGAKVQRSSWASVFICSLVRR